MKRTLNIMPSTSFLAILEEAQEQYKKDGTLPGGLNETEFFWITQRNEVWGAGERAAGLGGRVLQLLQGFVQGAENHLLMIQIVHDVPIAAQLGCAGIANVRHLVLALAPSAPEPCTQLMMASYARAGVAVADVQHLILAFVLHAISPISTPQPCMQSMMVSFTRADVADVDTRHSCSL